VATPSIYDLYSKIVLGALSVSKIKLNKCRRDFMIEIFMLYRYILFQLKGKQFTGSSFLSIQRSPHRCTRYLSYPLPNRIWV